MKRTLLGAAVAVLCLIVPARAEPPVMVGEMQTFDFQQHVCERMDDIVVVAAQLFVDFEAYAEVMEQQQAADRCTLTVIPIPLEMAERHNVGAADHPLGVVDVWIIGVLDSAGEIGWTLLLDLVEPRPPDPATFHGHDI